MGNKKGHGLIFGVIAGTVLGILFAPKKGKELRKQLKTEVQKGGYGTETLKENFMEMGKDMKETAEDVYHQPEVQKQLKKGKRKMNEMLDVAEDKVHEVEGRIQKTGKKYMQLGQSKLKSVKRKVGEQLKNVGNKVKNVKLPGKKTTNGKNARSRRVKIQPEE